MSEINIVLAGVIFLLLCWMAAERINLMTVEAKRRMAAKLLRDALYQEMMEDAAARNSDLADDHLDRLHVEYGLRPSANSEAQS